MLVVKVELWSAITGKHTEIARAVIHNVGTNISGSRGDYEGLTLKGRDEEALHKAMVKALMEQGPVSKRGEVKNHARRQEHVWVLVAKMLDAMGYVKK